MGFVLVLELTMGLVLRDVPGGSDATGGAGSGRVRSGTACGGADAVSGWPGISDSTSTIALPLPM
jgi:hypothetical protein